MIAEGAVASDDEGGKMEMSRGTSCSMFRNFFVLSISHDVDVVAEVGRGTRVYALKINDNIVDACVWNFVVTVMEMKKRVRSRCNTVGVTCTRNNDIVDLAVVNLQRNSLRTQ